MQNLVVYTALALLLVFNAGGVLLALVQLPGTWLILLLTAMMAWWQPERITWWTVAILAVIAVSAELLELLAGTRGAAKAGGSRRGAWMALGGGLVGALLGTFLIPVPVVGTVLGACLGAGLAALLGDCWAGRGWKRSVEVGKAAAMGRFKGTVLKVLLAGLMWLVVVVAVFMP